MAKAATAAERQAFIEKLWPMAVRAGQLTGLDPRLIVTQSALETGWGKSEQARQTNNYFGIKSLPGLPSQSWATKEDYGRGLTTVRDNFAVFKDPADSAEQYAAMMGRKFQDVLNVAKTGGKLQEQIMALDNSNYATDPNYGKLLRDVSNLVQRPVNLNDFNQPDPPPIPTPFGPGGNIEDYLSQFGNVPTDWGGKGLAPKFNPVGMPLEDFNATRYAALNPDIVAAGMDPTTHWKLYGQQEGRGGGTDYGWDDAAYLKANPDAANAVRAGEYKSGEEQYWHDLEHDIARGAERKDAYTPYVFDEAAYAKANPDLLPFLGGKWEELQKHYEMYGQKEGRGGAEYQMFDPEAYLDANPDLRAGGYDPLTHYQLYGQKEGRGIDRPIQLAKGGDNTGIGLTQDPSGAYVPNTTGAGGDQRFLQSGGAPSAADLNGFPSTQYQPPPVPDVSSNPSASASTIPGGPGYTSPDWQVPSFGNSSIYSPYGQPNGGLSSGGGLPSGGGNNPMTIPIFPGSGGFQQIPGYTGPTYLYEQTGGG